MARPSEAEIRGPQTGEYGPERPIQPGEPPHVPRRSFLKRLGLVVAGFAGGLLLGGKGASLSQSGGTPGVSAATFDFFRDAPIGVVVHYEGALNAHPNLPLGSSPRWVVIGQDQVLVGATVDADLGTVGGSESLTTEGGHAVTQPNAHASAGAHTHDAHTTAQAIGAVLSPVLTGPVTHASDGAHAHDAHSGTAVAIHATKKFRRSYVLKKTS